MTATERRAVGWLVVPVLLLALVAVGQHRQPLPDPGGLVCVTVEERALCDLEDARMDALMGREVGR